MIKSVFVSVPKQPATGLAGAFTGTLYCIVQCDSDMLICPYWKYYWTGCKQIFIYASITVKYLLFVHLNWRFLNLQKSCCFDLGLVRGQEEDSMDIGHLHNWDVKEWKMSVWCLITPKEGFSFMKQH